MKVFVILSLIISICLGCNLNCLHGGVPDAACQTCVGCQGAWSGTLCDTWDSTVPFDTLYAQLLMIAQNSSQNRGPVPTHAPLRKQHCGEDPTNHVHHEGMDMSQKLGDVLPLPSSLGQGIDISTGNLKLPILQLDYSAGNTFLVNNTQKFLIGANQNAQSINIPPFNTTVLYEGMYDYIQFLYNFSTTGEVEYQTLFATEPDLVNFERKYFSGDSYISVSKWLLPLYQTSLSVSVDQYQIDPRAKAALDFLPPDYSSQTNKALYRTFINFWGTHLVSQSIAGGFLELESFFQKTLLVSNNGPYTSQGIANEAANEFQSQTWGDGTDSDVDKTYLENRTLGTLNCVGGNAAELCDRTNLQNWKNSISLNPFAFTFTISDMSILMPEPTRSNIKQAISDYLTEIHDKWTVDYPTCPDCAWGTCTNGQFSCECYNSHITGKVCDQCVDGWMNDQCLDPICTNPCFKYGGVCTGPNTCSCYWPYYGKQCEPVCGDGIVQPPEMCDTIPPSICCSGCVAFGGMCYTAQGDCDENLWCNIADGTCPQHQFKNGDICHYSTGICDPEVECNGESANCPIPAVNPNAGRECAPAQGVCELPAVCDSYSTECPPNQYSTGPCECPNGSTAYCNGFEANCPCF